MLEKHKGQYTTIMKKKKKKKIKKRDLRFNGDLMEDGTTPNATFSLSRIFLSLGFRYVGMQE